MAYNIGKCDRVYWTELMSSQPHLNKQNKPFPGLQGHENRVLTRIFILDIPITAGLFCPEYRSLGFSLPKAIITFVSFSLSFCIFFPLKEMGIIQYSNTYFPSA